MSVLTLEETKTSGDWNTYATMSSESRGCGHFEVLTCQKRTRPVGIDLSTAEPVKDRGRSRHYHIKSRPQVA